MPRAIRFSVSPARCDRMHHIDVEDVRTVLDRLPVELLSRLRAVHLNDRGRGVRCLGYTTIRGRREIALCALPPRVSLTRFLVRGQSPATFGAFLGCAWPAVAVRRFLLYDVLLHEVGHLQIVHPEATTPRRRFADERRAQQFADDWRECLWSRPFDHPDPAHFPPSAAAHAASLAAARELGRRR